MAAAHRRQKSKVDDSFNDGYCLEYRWVRRRRIALGNAFPTFEVVRSVALPVRSTWNSKT